MRSDLHRMVEDEISVNKEARFIYATAGVCLIAVGVTLLTVWDDGMAWLAIAFGVFMLAAAAHAGLLVRRLKASRL